MTETEESRHIDFEGDANVDAGEPIESHQEDGETEVESAAVPETEDQKPQEEVQCDKEEQEEEVEDHEHAEEPQTEDHEQPEEAEGYEQAEEPHTEEHEQTEEPHTEEAAEGLESGEKEVHEEEAEKDHQTEEVEEAKPADDDPREQQLADTLDVCAHTSNKQNTNKRHFTLKLPLTKTVSFMP